MNLNLTDIYMDDVEVPEDRDLQILLEALQDPHRIDEAAAILSNYEADEIILDIESDYFAALQEELPNSTLVMGATR